MPFIVDKVEYKTNKYDGILLYSGDEKIEIMIEAGQFCCEDSGCDALRNIDSGVYTNEQFENKIMNSEIKEIVIVKDKYNEDEGGELVIKLLDDVFINIYNWHNGYYSHDFYIKGLGIDQQGTL